MQARYAFRKFKGTNRLQNIRCQQICMHDNIDIHLHFQKKCASSSKPPVLANLYTRRCLIPKLCPRSNLRCRQICIQDRSIFPKICVITSLQNLQYRQICTQDRSLFPKIYPILRLQKPTVPSNLLASIQPLCNVIPFWRFRASSKPEVYAPLHCK